MPPRSPRSPTIPPTPDFANTITALERSGKLLSKVSAVFYDLVSAHSNPALLEIDKEVSLRMARHWNPIMMNAVLFGRIALLHDNRATLGLTGEQMRLLERTYTRFHRAGAGLDEAAKARMAEINERLAHLGTTFSHHLLGDEQDWFMELGEADRDGLSDSFVAAAKSAADERGMAGKAIVTLSRSSVEPFLKTSGRRDLREKVYKAFTARGDNGNANDNNEIIVEILELREESARLLGYPDLRRLSAGGLDGQDAAKPCAACWSGSGSRRGPGRWPIATPCRRWWRRRAAISRWRHGTGATTPRSCGSASANFDDAAIKPYLALDHMIEAAFDCASRLFGLSFSERKDIPVWHPDVRVWEVKDSAGRHKALFYGDYFARPSKRSGAWMTSLRDQQKLDGDIAPLIINVCNFSKGADGEPSLLSPDDARTLFHEFGHGLHGMLSDVTYPSLSGHQRVHRFRRAALAALRALAGTAAGAAAVRPALPDRRAAAGRPVEALPRRAQIQPGLCHGGIRRLGADRPRIPHPAGFGEPRMCGRSSAVSLRKSGCPRKSRCGTGRSNSAISSPAIIMPRAITATCGPR